MSYSVTVDDNQRGESYAVQWDRLLEKVPPNLQFLSKDWYSAWEEKHLVQKEANSQVKYILLLDEKASVDGMFPYAEYSKFGLKILSLAGSYYPFRSILFSSGNSDDCAKALVESIHKNNPGNLIRIGPAYEDEPAISSIKQEFLKIGWNCYEIYIGDNVKIDLPETVSEYRNQLGKKFYKKIERRKRKFAELGDVKYVRYNDCCVEEWESVIDKCVQVEKRSWMAADEQAELRLWESSEFWKTYLQSKDASQRVVVWMIMLNGEPVAYSLAIDAGKLRYSCTAHYDEDYKKFGLGVLVDKYMFEDAVDCGINCIDMGTGEADYKIRWGAKTSSRIIDYVYLPPSLLGKAAYAGLKLRKKFLL